jgi:hypothetical protein
MDGDMNRWLARLSFSFFILAGVLGFEAYRVLTDQTRGVEGWRIGLYLAGAAALVVLGMKGVQERHRRDRRGGMSDDE